MNNRTDPVKKEKLEIKRELILFRRLSQGIKNEKLKERVKQKIGTLEGRLAALEEKNI